MVLESDESSHGLYRSEKETIVQPRWLWIILFVAFALRAIAALQYWAWFDNQFPGVWEASHRVISLNANHYILQADEFVHRPENNWQHRPYFRPPLASYYFAYLLKSTAFNRLAVSFIQSALACVAYGLLFLTAIRSIPMIYSLIGLAIIALHPVIILSDISFEDTTLSVFLLSVVLYFSPLLQRPSPLSNYLFSGLATAAAVLSRSNLILMAAFLPLAYGWQQVGARVKWSGVTQSISLFLAPVLIALGLTAWHNGETGGGYTPFVTTSGMTLFWGNSSQSYYLTTIEEGTSIALLSPDNPTATLLNDVRARFPAPTLDQSMGQAAIDYIQSHPLETLHRVGHRALAHLSEYEFPRDDDFNDASQHISILGIPYLPYALLFALALVGMGWGKERYSYLVFLFPVILVIITEVVFYNASRYRAMGVPFLVFPAMYGLMVWSNQIKAKRWNPIALSTTILLSCLAVAFGVVTPQEKAPYQATSEYKNLRLSLRYGDSCHATHRLPIRDDASFMDRMDRVLQLDPLHLSAFYLRTLFRMYNQQLPVGEVASDIAERRAKCAVGDGLCLLMADKLDIINRDREAYAKRVEELRAAGMIPGCAGDDSTLGDQKG